MKNFRTYVTSLFALSAASVFASGGAKKMMHKKFEKKKAIDLKSKKLDTIPSTVSNPKVGEIIVKCAGVAKKGANHCGANGHTCGGKAAVDYDVNEWVYLRSEDCLSKKASSLNPRIVGMKIIN